jgi:hypothetical protein
MLEQVAGGRVKKPDEFFALGEHQAETPFFSVEMEFFESATGQPSGQLGSQGPYQHGIVTDRHPASVYSLRCSPHGVSTEFPSD